MGLFLGEGYLGEGAGLGIAPPLVIVELDLTINRTVAEDANLSTT